MGRIFNASNCAPGASVYDVDAKAKLDHVLEVDAATGEVVRAHMPLRLVGNEIATYTERYQTIHPIYGDQPTPQLFHCYGRQAHGGGSGG